MTRDYFAEELARRPKCACGQHHVRPKYQAWPTQKASRKGLTTEDKLWLALLGIFVVTLAVALTVRGAWA